LSGERDPALEKAMDDVVKEWQESKKDGPFADQVPLFTLPELTRVIVAKQGDQVVGLLKYHLVKDRELFLVEQSLSKPGGPKGTSELMINQLLADLKDKGGVACTAATFGFEAAPRLNEISGFNWLIQNFARKTYNAIVGSTALGKNQKKEFRRKFGVFEE